MTSIVLAADGLLGDRLEEILATDHMVERLTEGADLLKVAQCRDDAVFITVLVQPLGDFLELLTAFRCRRPEGEIVVVSDGLVPAQVSLAVFRHGATDVVEQPVDQPERLLQAISKGILRQRQATESAQLVQQLVDRNYLLSRIHELLDELHRAPSLDALLSGVMPALREISGATAVAITVDGPEAVTAGWPLPHDAPADRTIPLHLEEQAVGTVHLQGAQMFAGYAISSEDLFIALTRQLALVIHHHHR
ncbi:MAG: hypothetical protein H7338_25205, partial [Candidatus Sericytochromatia bacterium]|nr:hypothetical protein [Candidatus Sericytochromatia bacterium]